MTSWILVTVAVWKLYRWLFCGGLDMDVVVEERVDSVHNQLMTRRSSHIVKIGLKWKRKHNVSGRVLFFSLPRRPVL